MEYDVLPCAPTVNGESRTISAAETALIVLSLLHDRRKWRGGVVTDLSEGEQDHWWGRDVYSAGGDVHEDAHGFDDGGVFRLRFVATAIDTGSGSGEPRVS